jgi:predicted Zn-ribbon and HTH transcriptional regulator
MSLKKINDLFNQRLRNSLKESSNEPKIPLQVEELTEAVQGDEAEEKERLKNKPSCLKCGHVWKPKLKNVGKCPRCKSKKVINQ